MPKVDQAEQHAARHRLDAVLAAGERGLQAERDHREVDALPPDRERADDQPERGGGRDAPAGRRFVPRRSHETPW
jgi:hypothetical protein